MARKRGITLFLYPMDGWNTGDGKVFDNPSLADCAEYGRKLGARFSDYPNIAWMVGGDYYSITDEPVRGSNVDHQFAAMLKGIRGSDSRLRSIQLSPGEFTGQEGVWDFQQGWRKKLDTRSAVQLKSVRDLFESLKGWRRLVPDTGHAFVTSGRGRRITTDAAVWPKSNDYVTAARTRRESLAVIYIPSARTITVDMARMRSGPSANWVDPTNGTRRRAKPEGTFRTPGRDAAGAGAWLSCYAPEQVAAAQSRISEAVSQTRVA